MDRSTAKLGKGRLDELLVERGLFPSRSRARDAIARGTVRVGGRIVTKAGQKITGAEPVMVDDPARGYVSRAALKLVHALDHFGLDAHGAEALDIGASTGGFTQILLERGAAHVTAVDVGHGQFHPLLRADPRVTLIEGLNARDLALDRLDGRLPDFLACDVSFISLRLALPPALVLAKAGATGVFLVKPQFEAGRTVLGKGGVLRDAEIARQVAADLYRWLDEFPGWRATGLTGSPVEGGDGNREYLLAGMKNA